MLHQSLHHLKTDTRNFLAKMFSSGASGMGEKWTQLGSAIAGLMFAYAMFKQWLPPSLHSFLEHYSQKLLGYVYPYIEITFHEYGGERWKRSELYSAIETYLGTHTSTHAKKLKAEAIKDSKSLVLSMDDHEEVTDDFQGVKLWWRSSHKVAKTQSFSFYPTSEEKRFYKLTFHRRHRDVITASYLAHVMQEGKAISLKNRLRKLYTNNSGADRFNKSLWSHVVFEHPASFDTLAMESKKKQDIISDLITFSKGKDYYAKIGKAWKRGYLLHGPPGTGKSTMIAAMANLLGYDVYDLELTAVKDNTQLRKLLIETSSKSIIVIEDIDCSLDLTGQRKKKKDDAKEDVDSTDPIAKKMNEDKDDSKVTLSGLLNFIDGLWSACGSERIIVFTTNYLEKLDPALIRRGRMDKHIELSYCCFEAFKVLAKNYLNVESHKLFGNIEQALGETKMTPADVAECLMPKRTEAEDDDYADACLNNLIKEIKLAKEEAKKKEEEDAKAKEQAEKEAKDKAEKEKKQEADEKIEGKRDDEKALDVKEVKENGVAVAAGK